MTETEVNTEVDKSMMEYPVEELNLDMFNALLRENQVVVDFLKKNGEFRSMKCTKSSKYIPEEDLPKDSENKEKKNNDLVTAWSFDREAWRSFYFSNVRRVAIELE